MTTQDPRIANLIVALRSYSPADINGVMVVVSRQACDEAADLLDRLKAELAAAVLAEREACVNWIRNAGYLHIHGAELAERMGAAIRSRK